MFASSENKVAKAIARNKFSEAKAMLLRGAGANGRCSFRRKATSLMLAVEKNHYGLVQILLEKGADVSLRDEGSANVAHYLAPGPNARMVLDAVMAAGTDMTHSCGWHTPLSRLAKHDGNLALAADLIARGVPLDTPLKYHASLVHVAADYNSPKTLRLFAKKGVPLDAQGNEGKTALHLAAANGRAEVVKALLDCGADASITDNKFNTAADLALKENHPGIAHYIQKFIKPAAPAPLADDGYPWRLLAHDEIAHVSDKPAAGYRLTEIFNFTRATCTVIARNLESGQESMDIRDFATFSNIDIIRQAAQELTALGGAPVQLPAAPARLLPVAKAAG